MKNYFWIYLTLVMLSSCGQKSQVIDVNKAKVKDWSNQVITDEEKKIIDSSYTACIKLGYILKTDKEIYQSGENIKLKLLNQSSDTLWLTPQPIKGKIENEDFKIHGSIWANGDTIFDPIVSKNPFIKSELYFHAGYISLYKFAFYPIDSTISGDRKYTSVWILPHKSKYFIVKNISKPGRYKFQIHLYKDKMEFIILMGSSILSNTFVVK